MTAGMRGKYRHLLTHYQYIHLKHVLTTVWGSAVIEGVEGCVEGTCLGIRSRGFREFS